MKPVVSVIIPCYNQEKYIAETLDSVLAQTFRDWECIVMDDGSSDGSAAVVRAYCDKDPRIKYFHQENGGVSKARNEAVARSCGEYILPLDGDDLIAPSYIEEALAHMRSNPATKLVYCLADTFGGVSCPWLLKSFSYEDFVWENCIFCTALFRRSDFDAAGGYNVNMVNGLEDWDFLLSLLGPEDVVYQIPKVLFHYRILPGSRTRRMDDEKELLWQILQNHPDIYKDRLFAMVEKWRLESASLTYSLERPLGHALTKPLRLLREALRRKKYRS